MTEPWLERWEQGRIGWHEPDGNAKLKACWADLPEDSRVLVPLCGKSRDLMWLADRALDVVGVELSQIAIEAFFAEHGLEYEMTVEGRLRRYRSRSNSISIHCGDYFEFESEPFDALFDRGALIAMPAQERPHYVAHTKTLLKEDAYRLIVTLEYEQPAVDGPPYAVMPDEIASYWSDLQKVCGDNDIDNCPPKFKAAGLTEVIESAWASRL